MTWIHPHESSVKTSVDVQVLKRLSNPLSWMDSLSSDVGGQSSVGVGGGGGSSTPPIVGTTNLPTAAGSHHHADPNDKQGVLSSVFSMTSNVTSNVSNMLTRYVLCHYRSLNSSHHISWFKIWSFWVTNTRFRYVILSEFTIREDFLVLFFTVMNTVILQYYHLRFF